MKVFEFIDRLQTIHKLVEERRTGTPEELAERLGIKKRTLFELIDELKSRNIPISYSRVLKSYYYTCPIDFKLDCNIKLLGIKELEEKNGGFFTSPVQYHFFALNELTFVM